MKTFSKVNSNWWSLFLWSPLVKMTCPPTSNTVVIVPSVWPNILSRKGRGKMEHEVKITLLKQWPIVSEVSEVCSFGITTNFNRLPDEITTRSNASGVRTTLRLVLICISNKKVLFLLCIKNPKTFAKSSRHAELISEGRYELFVGRILFTPSNPRECIKMVKQIVPWLANLFNFSKFPSRESPGQRRNGCDFISWLRHGFRISVLSSANDLRVEPYFFCVLTLATFCHPETGPATSQSSNYLNKFVHLIASSGRRRRLVRLVYGRQTG